MINNLPATSDLSGIFLIIVDADLSQDRPQIDLTQLTLIPNYSTFVCFLFFFSTIYIYAAPCDGLVTMTTAPQQ